MHVELNLLKKKNIRRTQFFSPVNSVYVKRKLDTFKLGYIENKINFCDVMNTYLSAML